VALMMRQKVLTGIGLHPKVEINRMAESVKESQHGWWGAVAAVGAPTACCHAPVGAPAHKSTLIPEPNPVERVRLREHVSFRGAGTFIMVWVNDNSLFVSQQVNGMDAALCVKFTSHKIRRGAAPRKPTPSRPRTSP
jgi:hypothetical protein